MAVKQGFFFAATVPFPFPIFIKMIDTAFPSSFPLLIIVYSYVGVMDTD